MKTFGAKEAKDGFGKLLDAAQKEPVTIEKKGRPVAVLVSLDEYARLESLEDAHWVKKAQEAAKEGFLNSSESENLLGSLLNAKD
jgi:prevent-host-death family protein